LGNRPSFGKEHTVGKNVITILIGLAMILIVSGCSKKAPLAPASGSSVSETSTANANPQRLAEEMARTAGWEIDAAAAQAEGLVLRLDKSLSGCVTTSQCSKLSGDVVHYSFTIRTGPGIFDEIGIHRVVKEKKALAPIKTSRTLFLLHGDAKDFTGIFQPGARSENTPDEFGIAWFLAENDVDVWGIDQAWTLVPPGTSNLAFMADWGLGRQVRDLSLAISVARFARLLTGSGFDPMILSGYSSGVITGYALLNEETQLPLIARQVSGFIPVDLGVKTDDAYLKGFFADYYTMAMNMIAGGQVYEEVAFSPLGQLAKADPDGASPILAGMTNMQAALFFGGGQIFGEGASFHYLAGHLESGIPTSLTHLSTPQLLDFLEASVPYEPFLFEADYCAVLTDAAETPYDDHLAQIQVPVFNVAAAGGFGELSKYGTTLLGSNDVTHLIVHNGAASILEEFGHIDLFLAADAPNLAWRPILNWIKTHSKASRNLL
jgi:hypothetical protein